MYGKQSVGYISICSYPRLYRRPNDCSRNACQRTKHKPCLLQNGQNGNGGTFLNEDRSRTNLIINYLPQSFDQNDLQRLFERVGPIRQCKLIRDKESGASLCYGFVDYVNPQHAALAIQTYHGYECDRKRLRVAYASSGGRRIIPGNRPQKFSNVNDISGNPNVEVTNENILGWEVLVTGTPIEWNEQDLLRLFSNFGAVVDVRPLTPRLPDSPSGQKPGFSPPLNGTSSDASSESPDGRYASGAYVIFQEKESAEISVLRLNGYQAPEWCSPLKLRLIGSLTRETFAHFHSSRQSPTYTFGRTSNSQSIADPLTESVIFTNVLNRRVLNTPNCAVHGNPLSHFVTGAKNSEVLPVAPEGNNLHLQSNSVFNIPPRAVMRNKVTGPTSTSVFNQDVFSHTGSLGILDFLDGHQNANSLSGTDQCTSRDVSIINTLNSERVTDNEQPELENSLKNLTSVQNHSSWPFVQHRSTLTALSENGRSNEIKRGIPTSGGYRRLSVRSPLVHSPILSSLLAQQSFQANIWLKLENIQPTGSYKIRGVENVIRKWAASGVNHIVCPATGSSAVAICFAAHAYMLNCTLVVPESHELTVRRRLALEAQDAKIVVVSGGFEAANHRADQLVKEIQSAPDSNTRLLHPYDQPELWEGYESIVDEISSEIGQPDAIVVAVGGGGLLSGIIQALWNKKWSSTHIITVENEGNDYLNRSLKSGQLAVSKSSSFAASISSPLLTQRALQLAQCQPVSAITCTDAEAIDGVKRFLDDHGMLVDPACGAALSSVYSGYLSRLQFEGRLPRTSNVVIIVGGGKGFSLRQLIDWENQMAPFAPEQIAASVLPPISSSYITHLSPYPASQEINKSTATIHNTSMSDHMARKGSTPTPSTPRSVCTKVSRVPISRPDSDQQASDCNGGEIEAGSECVSTLNSHDLVNFSKLLASSEAKGVEISLRES
uniref:L-serine ammonia-lyase n=1 Tax=Trichobilharzia regenti TaxID=157069 RepID=A0AA85JU95_TRIRE|nr:unnamed protein product [Trichobilharzia regenti]